MAAPEANLVALANFFKTVFSNNVLENLAVHPHPGLNACPKKGGFTGDNTIIPLQMRRGVGASSTFTTASSNYRPSKLFRWDLERKHAYRFVTIDAETIYASGDDKGAFVEQKSNEVKGAVEELGEKLAREFWGPGSGSLGVVAAIDSVSTPNSITLTNQSDVDKFWTEMQIVAAASEFTGALRDAGASIEISGRSIDQSKIFMDDVTLIPNLAVGDHLYVEGDRDDTGPQVITGVAAYIPLAEPTGADATLNGLTGAIRAAYPEETAGWRQTSFPGSIVESVEKLHAKMKRRGKNIQAIWLSHNNYRILCDELGDRVTRDEGKEAIFGVPGVKFVAGGTMSKVMADPFVPEDRGYSMDMSTWLMKHLLGLPHMVTDDGLKSLRGSTYDGIEMRWRYWAELVCLRPFNNGVFAINYN